MSWIAIPPPEWLSTEQEVDAAGQYLLQRAQEGNGIAFDTETTGLDIVRDRPILLSLSDGVRRFACWVEWAYRPWILDAIFQNPDVLKIATNAKFDMHMLANIGINVLGPVHDTIVMDWLEDENRMSHGLKDTARLHCGIKMREFKEVFQPRPGKTISKNGIKTKILPENFGDAIRRAMADPDKYHEAIEYSGLDAFASHHVHSFLLDRLRNVDMAPVAAGVTLWDHFARIEVPFTQVLYRMERRGITLHTGHLISIVDPMKKAMQEIQDELTMIVGYPLNPNSTPQLQKLFFEQLGREPLKMTDGGKTGVKKPSTDEEVLEQWAGGGDRLARLILNYRKMVKIKGTYIEGPLELVDGDLRLHTTLNQSGTVTGRLSSRDPNLQNIPRPDNDVFGIRHAFVAPPGKRLLVLDYDQLEMKLMAHFSGDDKMIGAIHSGLDLHCYTVQLMYGADYEEVKKAKKTDAKDRTPDQQHLANLRQSAKATGFGLIYGIGPKKLGQQLTEELDRVVDMDEAKSLIKKYFAAFPGVEAFIKRTHKDCREHLFVQTLVGRMRRLPMIAAGGSRDDDDEDNQRMLGTAAQAKRQAVNSIIQGTAADIAKAAMLQCEFDHELQQLGAKLLLQIHDELIFEVDDNKETIELTKKRVKFIMENPFGEDYQLRVPLTVGGSNAYTWAEAK